LLEIATQCSHRVYREPEREPVRNRHIMVAAALVAILLLAFFLWPQTPGEIAEPTQPGVGTGDVGEPTEGPASSGY
jgi:hypothetical protein